jgi:hypothetical protein
MSRLQPAELYTTSAESIRSILLNKCSRHIKHNLPSLTHWLMEPRYLYIQNWKTCALLKILESELDKYYDKPEDKEAIKRLLKYDIYRAIPEAAAAAWMVIDDFKLHHKYPNSGIPKNLSYGLILKAYEPITRVSSFISGLSYPEERECMPDEWLKEFHDYAVEMTVRYVPTLTSQYVESQVVNIYM